MSALQGRKLRHTEVVGCRPQPGSVSVPRAVVLVASRVMAPCQPECNDMGYDVWEAGDFAFLGLVFPTRKDRVKGLNTRKAL